ncbi:MAG: hypothetical protein HFI27_04190, partial [Lachnospiraceae bacterium]|nr:hypothetical protein [Lachnospiraceae bacterium]
MRKQIDPMLKTKLYLLAIGVLILAVLLFRKAPEPKEPESIEPSLPAEEPKEP